MSVRGGASEECPKLLSLREDTPLLALPDSVELLPSRPDWGLVGEAGIGCRGDCERKGRSVKIALSRQADMPAPCREGPEPPVLMSFKILISSRFLVSPSASPCLPPGPSKPMEPQNHLHFCGPQMALPLCPVKLGPRLLAVALGAQTEGAGSADPSGRAERTLEGHGPDECLLLLKSVTVFSNLQKN